MGGRGYKEEPYTPSLPVGCSQRGLAVFLCMTSEAHHVFLKELKDRPVYVSPQKGLTPAIHLPALCEGGPDARRDGVSQRPPTPLASLKQST